MNTLNKQIIVLIDERDGVFERGREITTNQSSGGV